MKHNKYIAYSLIILFCFVFLSWFFWDEYAASKIAPFQKTEGWNQWREMLPEGVTAGELMAYDPKIPVERKPGLFIRADSSSNLFLKHNYGKEIYLYDSQIDNIKQVSENDWLKAEGEITICYQQSKPEYNLEIINNSYPKYSATYRGATLKSYGKYSLSVVESPTRTKAAMLSAYGPLSGPSNFAWLGFGLGGSDPKVQGTRYVQIMRLDNKKYLQEPIRLVQTEAKHEFHLCWSKDERYVVAWLYFEGFSIIETNVDSE